MSGSGDYLIPCLTGSRGYMSGGGVTAVIVNRPLLSAETGRVEFELRSDY